MGRILSRRLFVAAVFCICAVAGAKTERCDVCGGRLSRRAWTYNGRKCCSQACIDQLRPRCSVCGNAIRDNYHKADDKIYCGKVCFLTTLPKCEICKSPIEKGFTVTQHHYCERCMEKLPTCFSCGLPAKYPTHLKDGRDICNSCMRWAVKDQGMAQKHYDRARRQLEAWTALKLKTVPELVLIDKTEMQQRSNKLRKSDSPVSVRGLYSRQTMMTKNGLLGEWKEAPELDQEKIYIVDHLTDEVFRVAATHELMHDLVHEYFPRLKEAPLWVHEGICQQAAAELCRRRNYADTLHGITECPDPDYGDGYRYINGLMGFEGWRALKRWMETVDVDALPEVAPK
ncbi:MAG: hypothetical protein ABFR33_07100 [Verrucomicrobiota bacterium]